MNRLISLLRENDLNSVLVCASVKLNFPLVNQIKLDFVSNLYSADSLL